MRVLVTGATGFVGGAIARRLLDRGDEVRVLVHRRPADELVDRGARPHPGDVLDVDAVREAAVGCEVVFHVAGINDPCPGDPTTLNRVNVEGAVAVVRAVAVAGCRRLVLTSSAAAIGEPAGTVGDETTRPDGRWPSEYARSKHLGERAALAEAEHLGVDLVVVNPASVQGPGRTGGSARLLIHALRHHRPLVVATMVTLVDVDDCVRGHLLAAQRGRSGERYLLAGAALPAVELVVVAGAALGRTVRPVVVPRGLVAALGPAFAGMVGRVRPDLPVCPAVVRTLLRGHHHDGGRAAAELGLVYTPWPETVRRTVSWYREHGLV